MGDRRNVQQQVGGAAEGGMHGHRVGEACRREHVGCGAAGLGEADERIGRADGEIPPHRLAARREGSVGQRQAQRLGDDLRGGGGAEKLAASAR